MHALAENETRNLVDAPTGVKPIGSRWVYKVKYNTNGSINQYKARLVERGYAQQHNIDYNETLVPVANVTTVCALLMVVVAKGCHLHLMDVKNAFLQVELEEQVCMVQPPDFQSRLNMSAVCRLKKSIYELKQPRVPRTRRSCNAVSHEVCCIQIGHFALHPVSSEWANMHFTLC